MKEKDINKFSIEKSLNTVNILVIIKFHICA